MTPKNQRAGLCQVKSERHLRCFQRLSDSVNACGAGLTGLPIAAEKQGL